MDKSNGLKPYVAGLVFSLFVGFSFVGVKIAIEYASVLEILTYRFNFAFVSVLLVLLLKIKTIDKKKMKNTKLLFTGTFYILFMIFQTIGLFFADSIEGAIMFSIIPVIVQILAGIFLKEKIKNIQVFFICISVVALIFMVVFGAKAVNFNPIGTGFLLLSSISMSISNVLMRDQRGTFTPFEMTASIAVQGALAFNVAIIFWLTYQGRLEDYILPATHKPFLLATAYLGIFCILFSSELMAYMQAKLKAANASIFGNLATAISIVAGILILGETLAWYHVICTALIITGVIGVSFSGRRKNDKISILSGK